MAGKCLAMRKDMKKFGKRFVSATLVTAMVLSTLTLSGCSRRSKRSSSDAASDDEFITLDVYSQLANYSGIQKGWSGQLLKELFNVEFNIIPEQDGVYETRMEEGELGDIVIWGSVDDKYQKAIEAGLLYDWDEDDLVETYGPAIVKYMQIPMEHNRDLTAELTGDENNRTLYGFGGEVGGVDNTAHQQFMYSWDIRWDLYKELGYPEVKDMEDLKDVFIRMKEICPKDDNGKETYALSMWPDWDGDMVMYVKCLATAYYGYDGDKGLGLYDPQTGNFYDTLMEDGPYLEMLKWVNSLYREGLVDPDSMTTNYNKMNEKVIAGGVFFSVFNYAGSLSYNTVQHLEDGKMMYSMKPTEAATMVYGLNPMGGTHIYSIGANTAYPERCMQILDYLTTPEGRMNFEYGPRGEFWDYDEDGFTYFTDLGYACNKTLETDISKDSSYSGTFKDGRQQWNNLTWALDAENPDSNGETFNDEQWNSTVFASEYEIQDDWRNYTGFQTPNDYFEHGLYRLFPANSFNMDPQSQELKTTWKQVTKAITDYSWKAIYSNSDAEFEKNVKKMIQEANGYGYDDCVKYSLEQAARNWELTQAEYKGALEGRDGAEAVEAEKKAALEAKEAAKAETSTDASDTTADTDADAAADDAAAE